MQRLLFIALACLLSVASTAQEQNRRDYSVVCHGTTKKGTDCKSRTYCNNSLCYYHGGNCYDKSKKSNTIKLPIIHEGNMKHIMISIGGQSYKYLIDSGASDVIINNEMRDYFIRTGILKSSDFGKNRVYEIANGESITMQTAILNSIKIHDIEFRNVNIAMGDNASLLLGMSFLNKYNWRFKGNYLEVQNK